MNREEINIKIISLSTELDNLDKNSIDYVIKDSELDELIDEREHPTKDFDYMFAPLVTASAIMINHQHEKAQRRAKRAADEQMYARQRFEVETQKRIFESNKEK